MPCKQVDCSTRTYAHIKGCDECRAAWPMIAAVLDTMPDAQVATATAQDILTQTAVA